MSDKHTPITGYQSLARQNTEGHNSLTILVTGAHCAGCIQKIESRLMREPCVKYARLNFSTRRLVLEWSGTTDLANMLVQSIADLGYGVHPYDAGLEKQASEDEEKFLLVCLGVAGFAMGNIMLLSVSLWTTTAETMGMATRDLVHWISGLVALPTVIYAGRPFFRSAYRAIRTQHTNMDVPISVALVLTSITSLFETIHHAEHVYFDSVVMLIFFLLIGRYLDTRARRSARSAATDLLATLSGFATVIDNDKTQTMAMREIRENMLVSVAIGEVIPADGIIESGITDIDTSLVTGETLVRAAQVGDQVYAGTMNMSAPITVRVARAAENSLLADIVRLMEKAGQGQARYVRLADRVARYYTPVVHLAALITFIGWWSFMGLEWKESVLIAITVLIITCPCALALAVPVVQVLATGHLMKKNILVKSGDALERLSKIDTAMIDKTGTLTIGRPLLIPHMYDDHIIELASSLASHSKHPLAKALSKTYQGQLLPLEMVEEHAGKGMSAIYQGKKIRLGSRQWCGDVHAHDDGHIELWLHLQDQQPVVFRFADQLRSDAAQTIQMLHNANIKTYLVSGDRLAIVQAIAQQAGIQEYHAEKSPTDKYDVLNNLKSKGHHVLMVGDGLNDAPVLAGADVSMAPGTAIDMAQNAADIIFMGEDLRAVAIAIRIARLTQKLVYENFMLTFLYNMIAIPLAVMGYVTPLMAAAAMSISSLVVIANSFRVRMRG